MTTNSIVEKLIKDGQWRQAIDQLSAKNRQQESSDTECELAELRLKSFGEIDWQSSKHIKDSTRVAGDWPPQVPDVFADTPTGTIPEINADQLSAEALAAGVFIHGSVIVRGLVDPLQAQSLARDIDEVLAAQHRKKAGDQNTAPWFAPPPSLKQHKLGVGRKFIAETGGIWAIDSPRALFRVLEVYEQLGLRQLLTELFGEDPCLSVRKWVLRRVSPISGESDWHQDGAFMGTDIRSCNLWIALNECGGDTNTTGIELIPKKLDSIVGTGTDGARFDWVVGPEAIAKLFPDTPPVRPHFQAGDAVFFDHFNLHRTAWSPNLCEDRYAIECWFFAPSSYPKDQIAITF